MRHLKEIMLIVFLAVFSFTAGSFTGVIWESAKPPEIMVRERYIYVETYKPGFYSPDHVRFLNGIIERHEEELNRRGKRLREQELELGIRGFKISVYRAMTGQEVDVKAELAGD